MPRGGQLLRAPPGVLQQRAAARPRSRLAASRVFAAANSVAFGVGSKVPDVELSFFNAEGQMEKISTKSLCSGKKGVDTLVCVSVNDPFVMDAWAKSVDTKGKVLLLADGSGLFTKACGLELDLTEKGLGMRSRRYAMLLEDGVVKTLRLEEGGAFTVSSAEDILASM